MQPEGTPHAPTSTEPSTDRGSAAPTPLFLGFIGALLVVAVAAFHGGITFTAVVDFLLLAAVVTGSVMVAFAAVMIWGTRAGQRASHLAAHRPGAIVARCNRTVALARAARRLREPAPLVPARVTLVADDTGVEMWGGSAEHPVRVGRVPWESVDDIRPVGLRPWGRATRGVAITVRGADGESVELPFVVVGAGLGGLFPPSGERVDALIRALRDRRAVGVAAR